MSEPTVLRGHDILCFSSIDWRFIWQGHQEIMSTLAANGNRVLFVENTGVRAPSIRDLPRIWQRVHNWWKGTKGFRRERKDLFIYSPLLLPFPYSSLARRVNRVLLVRALRRWMQAASFGRPIVWTFLPTPLVREVIPLVDPIASVYYCIDDFASSSPAARRITGSEDRLFREVDLVFVTSEQLRARAAKFSDRVHLFPFGVSFKKFELARQSTDEMPADLGSLKRPVIGYIGGIHRWIDFELLARAARMMPDASFALIGPLQIEGPPCADLVNVHILGKRSHDAIPSYINGFDVGIVPYVLSDYTANVYPTKLNEYLAMGLPVVATDLPEIRRFNAEHGGRVTVATSAEQFVKALRSAIGRSSDGDRVARIEVARKNSWDARIAQMSTLIVDTIEERRTRPEPWEKTLQRIYRRARARVAGAAAAVVLIYALMLETSLPWIFAEPLRLSADVTAADAIVVFAGGVGESGQAGGGYQERVKMAVDTYQAGYAQQMVFVSGYAFAFPEAEIMRDLAVSLGVRPSAIVLEAEAGNTYEYVVRTHAILKERRWRRILLVSSPYHMQRAMRVWAKQAPDIEVVPTPVAASQFYTHGRGATLEQIRGVVREYLAIVYYKAKGWL